MEKLDSVGTHSEAVSEVAEQTAPALPVPPKEKKKKTGLSMEKKDLIFVLLMLVWPVLQFGIFYIGVNLNSFALAFEEIDVLTGSVSFTLDNFRRVFSMLISDGLLHMMGMSLLNWAVSLVAGTTLGLLFSYYIYKKFPLSGFFRVILFMPSVISAIVMIIMFRFFVEQAIPDMANTWFGSQMTGLIENPDTRLGIILFYGVWVSFGTSVLMYSNKMATIDPEIVEAAHLDGATGFKEFWHVTMPMVYPTLSVFLVTGVAGIFSNQMNLYSFYGGQAPEELQTLGYYLYMSTRRASSDSQYPIIAAIGFLLSLVAVPVTLLVRYLLGKYGPSEDR